MTALALDRGAGASGLAALMVQFGIAARRLTLAQAQALAARLKVSTDCRDAALNAIRHVAALERADSLPAEDWLALLTGLDALRRPERLDVLLAIHAAWAVPGSAENANADRVRARAMAALQAISGIDYRGLQSDGEAGVAQRVRLRRLGALREWLAGTPAGN
jgi:hypothetical protein